MQDAKWQSQERLPSYLGLASNAPYRGLQSEAVDHSNESPMQGLMSMTQPGTPRPSSDSPGSQSPDSRNDSNGPPHPTLPARPASFSSLSSFPSHSYQLSSPIRRRRTESVFSFDMGPSFTMKKQLVELYSQDQTNRYQVQLNAKMDRGFFRAEQEWACYRRNYFQVSATFEILGINYHVQNSDVPCLLRWRDELHHVEYFSVGISACVSGSEDKKVSLVQHTPKRDKGPQMVPKPQVVRAGGSLHLASVGSNQQIATFERMQFKTATANNGKRRAAQQYYEIIIELYANIAQGEAVPVAAAHSAPLVVRGRSPGHYADSHTRHRPVPSGPTDPTDPNIPPPPPPGGHLPPPRFPGMRPSAAHASGHYPYYPYQVGYQQPSPNTAAVNGPYTPQAMPSHMDQASYFLRPQEASDPKPSGNLVGLPPLAGQPGLMYEANRTQPPYFGESSGLYNMAPGRADGKMVNADWPSSGPVSDPSRIYAQHPYDDYNSSYNASSSVVQTHQT